MDMWHWIVEKFSSIDRMGFSGLIVGLDGLAFAFRQYRVSGVKLMFRNQ